MGSQLTQFSSQVTECHIPKINFDQRIYSPHSIYQKIQTRKFICLLFKNIYQGGHSSKLKGPLLCCAGITNA
jgi:hypothetical protein